MSNESIRVLLADDHPAARAGVRAALEKAPDVVVVAEVGDGEKALRLIEVLRPNVALLDCHLPGLKGAQVTEAIRERGWPTRVLALSAYKDDRYVYGMLQAGAVGYLLEKESLERIVEAVRCASRGEVFFSEEQRVRARCWREEVGARWESLTAREREVLRLLLEGPDNAAIAEALCVTSKTVEYHVTNTLSKLGIASRLEAVVWVRDHWPDGLPGNLQHDLGKSPG